MFGDDVSMRRETTTVRGGAVRYWRIDRGRAQTALLLHGLGGDHVGLAELADGLPGLNIVAPDLPGYGESEPLPGEHTLAAYADAVRDLRDHLGLGSCHLIGHSLGASIALAHAARHGAGLDSLCLLNPVSAATGLTAALGKTYYRVSARLSPRAAGLWLTSRPAVYLSDAFVIATSDRERRRWILAQDYRNYARSSVRAMIESFLSYFETDFAALAAAVPVRTLVLTGDRDGIAPPRAVARLAGQIPTSRLVVLPGGGHLLPVENPVEVAAEVREFVSGVAVGRMIGVEGE